MARKQPSPTSAHDNYLTREQTCRELIKQLSAKIDRHNLKELNNQSNWGFSGDLGYVEELLQQAVDFLNN